VEEAMIARWQTWRRDLLFALAGVVVASAVLVPVGWSHLQAERHRAEAAEEAARVERERAEAAEAAAHRERERALVERSRADANLVESRKAVEAFLKANAPRP
jgi:hypothetical protein